MNLNLQSLTQAMHGLLKASASYQQPAKVINISSIDGIRLSAWDTYSYQASKAALIHLTKRMAARLVQDQIHVTSIAPGAFASEMNKRDLSEHVPNRSDDDMAGIAIYLAARSGDYVVGETIAVDGGVVNAQMAEGWDIDPAGSGA